MTMATDRRTELLDAALDLVGEGGLRAVTHRAVEQRAGAPHGSTTYYFKTRDQLVEATIQRLTDIDRTNVEGIAHGISMALARGNPDYDAIADALIAWINADRLLQLARFELHVASARDPDLKALMSAGSARFWHLVEPLALTLGSKSPVRDSRVMVAMLDGLVFDYLTRDPPDPAVVREGVRRILTG
jgi:DNA-binding transcriptional regulator YbjK